ncbi:MerR family transcriptional regulator, partial [Ligilactobacillus animalis]
MTMLKPKEMAERLGVTVRTLQIWDSKGVLKAYWTPTNRRYYTEEQYLNYIGKSESNKRKVVAYARVSTNSQRD